MAVNQIQVGKTTIGDLVDIQADQRGAAPALRYPSLGISHTFAEFRNICNDVAKGLMALGIARGEHIAIWANNVPEWVYLQFGSARMGAVLVTVNTNYRAFELEYLLKQSDATTLILVDGIREADEYLRIAGDVCPELTRCEPGKLACAKLPLLKNVVRIGPEPKAGMYTWQQIIAMGQSVSDAQLTERMATLEAGDVINMQYTSGTTGFPKGVMLTHTNLIGNALSMAECMNLSPGDALCIPVPFFHCFGCVIGTLCSMVSGTTMAPVASFDPKAVLETIDACRCTAVHGVPTMFIAELEEMAKSGPYDTSHLRTGVMAGSPCPIEIMKKVVSEMGAGEMTIVYGQTEASPGITQTRRDDPLELRVGTVGRALPNVEVKIVDAANQALASGEQGELCTRGYHVMKGYYKMPEATAKAIDADGWLHTGDLAVMDENGNCRITGRIKDMIIRGGENIYPREIEEFLYTHPAIRDVQVYGVPSRKYGEEVAASIMLKPGEESSAEAIQAYCRDKIAFHKIPAHIFFVEAYPTTASGKIQKYKLREQATASLGRQEEAAIETA